MKIQLQKTIQGLLTIPLVVVMCFYISNFNIKTYHKMEDLIIFRKQRATKGQWMSHELPRIKIEMPRGTFVVFKKVADLLKAGNRDAVMFAFNKKDKCAYIYKEEPEEDSYYLSNSGREYYRFTSKELMLFFIDFFGIEKEKAVYFDVDSTPQEPFPKYIRLRYI